MIAIHITAGGESEIRQLTQVTREVKMKKTVKIKRVCAACLSYIPQTIAGSVCPRCRAHYASK